MACLLGLLVVGALDIAQGFFAPIFVGLMVGVVMSPAVRKLERWRLPRVVGALLGVAGALAATFFAGFFAGPLLAELVDLLPRLSDTVRDWVAELRQVLRGVEQAGAGNLAESGEQAVEEALPNVIGVLWMAPNFLGQTFIAIGTLFFFLLTRDEIYDAVGSTMGTRLRRADRAVSHYFLTITLINCGLGIAVAGAMSIVGISNPIVWGAAAFFLNFVLYLGPAILAISLLIAGLIEFSGAMVLLPPATFLILNLIEAQFVTPSLVGQRLNLNPLAVFLAIVFGLWLWGPVGGIVALPFFVWLYVLWTCQAAEPATKENVPEPAARSGAG
ncbi:MAG: AI-2E family transporter [Pseudomonadota bacterium]